MDTNKLVIGYFVDKLAKGEKESSSNIFVALNEECSPKDNLTIFAPQGGHSGGDKKYLKKCTMISKQRYIDISKGLYTPEEYLL